MNDHTILDATAAALGVRPVTCTEATCPGHGTPHYVGEGDPEFHRAYDEAGDGWSVEVNMWPAVGHETITPDDEWLVFIQAQNLTGPADPANALQLALAITTATLEARTRNARKRGERRADEI